jgi:hypothetical protein
MAKIGPRLDALDGGCSKLDTAIAPAEYWIHDEPSRTPSEWVGMSGWVIAKTGF